MRMPPIVVAAGLVGAVLLSGGCTGPAGGGADRDPTDVEEVTTTDTVGADELRSASGGDAGRYSWTDLRVTNDQSLGYFTGSIRVTNDGEDAADVRVEVTAVGGQQRLGTLTGLSLVESGAATTIGLTSLDEFARATTFEVELSTAP